MPPKRRTTRKKKSKLRDAGSVICYCQGKSTGDLFGRYCGNVDVTFPISLLATDPIIITENPGLL